MRYDEIPVGTGVDPNAPRWQEPSEQVVRADEPTVEALTVEVVSEGTPEEQVSGEAKSDSGDGSSAVDNPPAGDSGGDSETPIAASLIPPAPPAL